MKTSSLQELEKSRKLIIKRLVLHIIAGFVICYLLINLSYDWLDSEKLFVYKEVIGVYFIAVYLLLSGFLKYSLAIFKDEEREFRQAYKDIVFVPFFKKLNLKYKKYYHVHAIDILNSGLFSKLFDTQDGNDYVYGNVGEVRFSFSDVFLYDIKYSLFKDIMFGYLFSRKRKKTFAGLVFVAEFNKVVNSTTKIQSKNFIKKESLKKIVMDNAEFNDIFNVFTDDEINANYILSPKFMQNLIQLNGFVKFGIRMSFNRQKIYIVLNHGKDSFEPSLFRQVIKDSVTKEIKKEILSVVGIIKTLDLNNKIWLENSAWADEFYR
ncbi:DUF3137 domain-containing protein [Campylobacter geochelonis]|uniref:DUF3137 domain-containing protein n=1 Tax=Campylobacter geochelonis TaxID=1780362 RepID=UPI000770A980|nr:DUF3137 domain-containing protein [Campylobacter geochelonis]CZE49903.1 putative Galanin [Campylobacter geochelonis]